MESVWLHKGIEYKAYPITIGDWKMLGKYLRAYLLDDLKYQEDIETRLQNMNLIQMRDYDESDIMRHWSREDINHKVIKTIFKNNPVVTSELIAEWDREEAFTLFLRSILKDSGIKFIEESEKQENP